MKATATRLFPHPREHVWSKLMDFDVLGRTLPGVESLTPVDDESCELTVKVLVPSITGTYKGMVRVVEKEPTDSYRLRGDAKGRLGWVKGEAYFALHEVDGGTEVESVMDFQSGGVIAGVGQRFMEGIARSMLRDFFGSFEKEL